MQLPKRSPFEYNIKEVENLIHIHFDERIKYGGVLSRDERNAIEEYCKHNGQDSLQDSAPYLFINQYIRDLVEGNLTNLDKNYQRLARIVFNVINKHSQPVVRVATLYRGMKDIPKLFAEVEKEDIVVMNQFVSMTSNPLIAEQFCTAHGAMLVIQNASGFLPNNSAECEYIGQAGSQLRVDDIYTQDWFSDHETYETTVFEVTMLKDIIPIPSLAKKSLLPWNL